MTAAAWVLLALAAFSAVADWVAVARGRRQVEYVLKPLTLVLLIGVALALDPHDPTMRWWFVAGLVLSLAGDVFLMLPRDAFVAGLSSFLLAHVAYVVGLLVDGVEPALVAVGVAVVVAAAVVVGRRMVGGILRTDRAMLGPVAAYMTVISAMVVCAVGTGSAPAIAGALSFYVSDALIGWGRFVRSHDWGRTAVMVTYHVGQVLLVAALI